jgi:ethanolamine permease
MNALGVALAARFELFITLIATFELLLFFGLTGPHVELSQIFSAPMLPFGWAGVFGAIPFAIWFYLALEGVAMSAEETIAPKKNIPKGYIAGIITLVTLAMGTLICTTGVMPWQELVTDDSPLPRALASVLSADHALTHMMVYLGLFGLIASFHGIIMGYSRQVFALAREGYLPRWLAYVSPRFRTPVFAIYVPGMVGVLAVLSDRTDALISLAGMGAIVLYIISMLSLFALRRREPAMERPFIAPMYPFFPATALILAVVCLVAVVVSDPSIGLVFACMMLAGLGFFKLIVVPHLKRDN